ncbi:MAG TPA: hypothetical protein VK961_14350, partial [Chthoniobacter sp.]|nr:hypothetical protein [Chthoniobacter sp.]
MKTRGFILLISMAMLCRAQEPPAAAPSEKPLPKPDATAPAPATIDPAKQPLPPPAFLKPAPLDAARLEHGRTQVRQMFADRFMMGVYR